MRGILGWMLVLSALIGAWAAPPQREDRDASQRGLPQIKETVHLRH